MSEPAYKSDFTESMILIVGLGSMGKRRIRNLQLLGFSNIHGYDIRPDRSEEAARTYNINILATFEETASTKPDILIISTPPDQHLGYGLWAAGNNTPFFIEASVLSEGMDKLITLCRKNKAIGVPSCTPRFHPSISKMKEIIRAGELGKLLSFSHHYGSCYTDWHPWEDYRETYYAKREIGAGRESVTFEVEWLEWLFGDFQETACFFGKRLDLEPDIDDTYQIITRGENGVLGNIFVEVTSKHYFRITKAIFSNGTMVWDWRNKKVVVYGSDNEILHEYAEPAPIRVAGYKFEENMYVEEMRYFLDVVLGSRTIEYSLEDDLRVLKKLDLIESGGRCA